jgi:hypothetical protein
MNFKDLLAKLLKGDALTDDEKKTLADFDPDAVAAAARKQAEKEAKKQADKAAELEASLAELKGRLDDVGKSEAEKAKAEQDKAAKQLAELKVQVETLSREKGEIIRGHKLAAIAGRLKLVPGVERDLVDGILKAKLAGLKDEELDDEKSVDPILKAFREANKALILDESGHGSGGKRDGSTHAGGSGETDPSKQSDAERLGSLRNLDKA